MLNSKDKLRVVEKNEHAELTAQEYFDMVKSNKQTITDAMLTEAYINAEYLMKKYLETGQLKGAKKLYYHLECVEKEREVLKLGVNTFIYKDDIEYFIDSVTKNTVKIIELSNYEREVPDEIVDIVKVTKDIFDEFYVVFTDYTGKVERQISKERREKDPILFGTFKNSDYGVLVERFYYLGDWIDEYCDLTLDKMVTQMKSAGKSKIVQKVYVPSDLEDLKKQLDNVVETSKGFKLKEKNLERLMMNVSNIEERDIVSKGVDAKDAVVNTVKEKKSFFSKVKSVLKRG